MMKLFTDGSVHPQTKIGFGSYMLLDDKPEVQTKRFENTSSTKLELETLLWALESIVESIELTVYTDCQNILGLQDRRERFEQSDYHTKTGKKIKEQELYKKFFRLTDKRACTFVKVKGHKKSALKDEVDELFTLVDRASRDALREYLKERN